MIKINIIIVSLFLILISTSVLSQEESAKNIQNNIKKTVKERKATLNFEDELVEGGTQKPELFYLFQKKNFNYKRLIKLRDNFIPEMRKTSEEIQRVRGAN